MIKIIMIIIFFFYFLIIIFLLLFLLSILKLKIRGCLEVAQLVAFNTDPAVLKNMQIADFPNCSSQP